jgi:hypothetical protein
MLQYIAQLKTSGLSRVKLYGKHPLVTIMCEGAFFNFSLSLGRVVVSGGTIGFGTPKRRLRQWDCLSISSEDKLIRPIPKRIDLIS